mmetsp:Transcript_16920/g.39406  ORF Transcript_16920/g.39406 Transcript_16920/m.39406 type:complete len:215 (+) Transcript_16920:436-1080(+)
MFHGSSHLLWGLHERIRNHKRNCLFHLQGWDLGHRFPREALHRRSRSEMRVGEHIQFVHQLAEELFHRRLLLILLFLLLRLVIKHLGFVLLGIYVTKAYTTLLEVEHFDSILFALTLWALGWRQYILLDDIIIGFIPHPLFDDLLNVKLRRAFKQAICAWDIVQTCLARFIHVNTCGHGFFGSPSCCEVCHRLVKCHLQEGVEWPLFGRNFTLQ